MFHISSALDSSGTALYALFLGVMLILPAWGADSGDLVSYDSVDVHEVTAYGGKTMILLNYMITDVGYDNGGLQKELRSTVTASGAGRMDVKDSSSMTIKTGDGHVTSSAYEKTSRLEIPDRVPITILRQDLSKLSQGEPQVSSKLSIGVPGTEDMIGIDELSYLLNIASGDGKVSLQDLRDRLMTKSFDKQYDFGKVLSEEGSEAFSFLEDYLEQYAASYQEDSNRNFMDSNGVITCRWGDKTQME